jgi:tetratricopeptide (TPR) repeat protein
MRPLLAFLLALALAAASARADATIPPASTNLATPANMPKGPTAAELAAQKAALQAKAQAIVDMLHDAGKMFNAGDIDGSLAKVNQAIQADPKSVAGYLLRGAIYTKKNMYPQAQNDFQTAYLLAPNSNVVQFNLSEIKFIQKQYDAARPGFVQLVSADKDSDIGDLANYKVFLCDLFGSHEDLAAKELDAFNQVGSNASYYYANAAWDLFHHQTEDARGWLQSATNIYAPQKNGFYMTSLTQLGYLPLPPPGPH